MGNNVFDAIKRLKTAQETAQKANQELADVAAEIAKQFDFTQPCQSSMGEDYNLSPEKVKGKLLQKIWDEN